jgi:hypothetical protein
MLKVEDISRVAFGMMVQYCEGSEPADSPNHDPLCSALWIGVLLDPSAKLSSARNE